MALASHKIMIIGFGTVGQGFYELFNSKRSSIGLDNYTISEIVDLKLGFVSNPEPGIIDEIRKGKTFPAKDVVQAIRDSSADIVCEFTWVNFRDAEPAFTHIKTALESGKNVITTNKGPIALRFSELEAIAHENGTKLLFKGTVMAGTPSFNLLQLLPGASVTRVRGIMNGTTNYILARMSSGVTFTDALKEAQSKGYAEADPTNDVDGYDAAAKAAIISNVLGWNIEMSKVAVQGIRNVTPKEAASGVKLLVTVDRQKAEVRPTKLEESDTLRHVSGVMNAIELETDTLGKIYCMGPGAGRTETAQAVLTDLVALIRDNSTN